MAFPFCRIFRKLSKKIKITNLTIFRDGSDVRISNSYPSLLFVSTEKHKEKAKKSCKDFTIQDDPDWAGDRLLSSCHSTARPTPQLQEMSGAKTVLFNYFEWLFRTRVQSSHLLNHVLKLI